MTDSPLSFHQSCAEVCFDGGGRVRIEEIPEPNGHRPPIGCTGCHKTIGPGEGFFIEVDDMQRNGWGVGTMVVCGPCMAIVLRPRNIIEAVGS